MEMGDKEREREGGKETEGERGRERVRERQSESKGERERGRRKRGREGERERIYLFTEDNMDFPWCNRAGPPHPQLIASMDKEPGDTEGHSDRSVKNY